MFAIGAGLGGVVGDIALYLCWNSMVMLDLIPIIWGRTVWYEWVSDSGTWTWLVLLFSKFPIEHLCCATLLLWIATLWNRVKLGGSCVTHTHMHIQCTHMQTHLHTLTKTQDLLPVQTWGWIIENLFCHFCPGEIIYKKCRLLPEHKVCISFETVLK